MAELSSPAGGNALTPVISVYTDNETIEGNGTRQDPLRAIGGSSGGALSGVSLTVTPPLSATLLNGDNNNFSPAGSSTASVWRLNANAGAILTGMVTGSANTDGKVVILQIGTVLGFAPLEITNLDSNSTAGNQFALPGGQPIYLTSDSTAAFMYNATLDAWQLVALSSGDIGTTTVHDTLNVNGAFVESGNINVGVVTGTQDNYNPGGAWPLVPLLIIQSGPCSLSGLLATNVKFGQRVTLFNSSTNDQLIILDTDSGSATANQFSCPEGENYEMVPQQVIDLIYLNQWYLIAPPPG